MSAPVRPTPVRQERHCAYCGDSLGALSRAEWDRNDTCGKRECQRWAMDQEAAEREEAHDRLDRDNGWGQR